MSQRVRCGKEKGGVDGQVLASLFLVAIVIDRVFQTAQKAARSASLARFGEGATKTDGAWCFGHLGVDKHVGRYEGYTPAYR